MRRILKQHYKPGDPSRGNGSSWLSFIGHVKDSLWSVDFFKCASVTLRSHWVLVVMDQWCRRIIGFGVHADSVDGPTACKMFMRAIAGQKLLTSLSTDHDPLFKFHRCQANLRTMGIEENKTGSLPPLTSLYRTTDQYPPP